MGCSAGKPLDETEKHERAKRGSDAKAVAKQQREDAAAAAGRGHSAGMDRAAAENSRRALRGLLASEHRDFLVDAAGRKVKLDSLKGAAVGILFTAQAIPSARAFQRTLVGVQAQLRKEGRPMEVVLISNDETEEMWRGALSGTHFLALPFGEHTVSDALGTRFGVCDLPTLVLLDREGRDTAQDGVEVVSKWGAAAWPFDDATLSRLRTGSAVEAKGAEEREDRVHPPGGAHKGKEPGIVMAVASAAHVRAPRDSQVAPEEMSVMS